MLNYFQKGWEFRHKNKRYTAFNYNNYSNESGLDGCKNSIDGETIQ